MSRQLTDRLIPIAASGLIRTLYKTVRIRWWGREHLEEVERDGGNFILAFWHGQILMMIRSGFRLPMTAMISQHRDGELIAETMKRFGADSARGSTTRGGSAALRTMMRAAREGSNLAITPDGPKGPRHVAQPGAVILARATGLPILPATFSSKKKRSSTPGIVSRFRCRSRGPCISSENRSGSPGTSRRVSSKSRGHVWRHV